MRNIGIYYYSKYGQTRKIAEFLKKKLQDKGCAAIAVDLRKRPEMVEIPRVDERFDTLIIAAPLYARRYPKRVVQFIKKNNAALSLKNSGFCSISLAEASRTEEAHREVLGPLTELMLQRGWSPQWVASFPGALEYRRYSVLIRMIMKRISRQTGGPTDTSRDYEFTDWDEVARFASEIAENRKGGEFSKEQVIVPRAA